MDTYDVTKFKEGLKELGLVCGDAQTEQFLLYYKLLTEWNQKMNLTAVTAFDDVVEKHFLDSLCLIKAVPDLDSQTVADLGTGAGFPGIPLKIVFPGLSMVLIDSVGKKLSFLDEVIEQLGLSDIVTVHGRAEDLAHQTAYRGRFDLVVSRAVSQLAVLAEYSLPFLKKGGRFIAYKSKDVKDECRQAEKAVSLLGGEEEQIVQYVLPGTDTARSLVCIQKKKDSPKAYPRKAGTPARNPLK